MADEALVDNNAQEQAISAKATRRAQRKAAKQVKAAQRNPKPIEPRTKNQSLYIKSLKENELSFGIGPAGVGKTYVPARVYGAQLASGEIKKLYLARPNISKNKHRNGFLPGTEKEKTAPWLVPIMEGLRDAMGKSQLEAFERDGSIEVVPYEFIQGRTFSHDDGAACIVDEAENLDIDDLYITLTRQGEGLNMVLCGDIRQARIPDSGLAYVVEMAKMPEMESVGVVEFDENDVVRSRQAAQWVKAFNRMRLPQSDKYVIHNPESFNGHPPDFLKAS